MSQITGKAVDIHLLSRIMHYVRPYRALFIWATFLTVLLALIAPLSPLLIQYTVDHFIFESDFPGLIRMTLIMIVITLLQSVFQYYQTYSTNQLGQSVILDLRKDTFNHITSLRVKYFDRTPIGMLITRTVSDLETIADIFSEGLIAILGSILQVITLLAVMLWSDWRLALITLIPMPLLILATYVFKEAIKSAFQDVRTQVTRLNTFLQEHITGMPVIQYFAREEQEMKKFDEVNVKYRDANIRSNWYYSIFFPVVEIISALSLGLLVWFGSVRILGNQVSPGMVTAFILYINMLFRPIRELADKFNTLQMGMVGAGRIFSVLDTQEQTANDGTLKPKEMEAKIAFDHVWFAYNDENWVLKDISFTVNPGETVALVGATGAGKSSTINILNRFYEIGKGSVKIDDIDIKQYEIGYLRSQIATVLQDVFLFSDSVSNNINLQNEHISRQKIMEAAKEVGAHAFIKKLPGGYDYEVMERGATLSAGQAQLISFIRALVHDPKILVLDEATSSVDTESELLIQNAIDTLMKGRTSIVIAHRLSTIQKADKIIVLDKGEIKEMGNHQELLKLNGFYKRLYDLQFSSVGINV